MNRADVFIGMKVVPRRKSIGLPLYMSNAYNDSKAKGQPYLYVVHQHMDDKGTDRFLLSDSVGLCGDYFLCSDFEPYEEEDKMHGLKN